jgi:hypothetical protein
VKRIRDIEDDLHDLFGRRERDLQPMERRRGVLEHGEYDLKALAPLTKRLAEFCWHQLAGQEGSWVGSVRGAVIFLAEAALIVRWDGEEVSIEPTEEVVRPPFPNLGMLGQAHPPMLDLSRAMDGYPFSVPYSCSAGTLAGRTGTLLVKSEAVIEDDVFAMS